MYLKWKYFLMPGSALKCGRRCSCQFDTGTNDVPSSLPTNWDEFRQALPFTTDSSSDSDDIAWRLKARLRSPKQASGANFVCPTTRKLSDGLVETNGDPPCQIPQDKTVLVLPCAIVTVEVGSGLTQPKTLKKVV